MLLNLLLKQQYLLKLKNLLLIHIQFQHYFQHMNVRNILFLAIILSNMMSMMFQHYRKYVHLKQLDFQLYSNKLQQL